MSVKAYNKVTRIWTTTVDGTDLPSPQENWVVDPVFQDEAFAMQIGQQYWTFNGNTINTPSIQEYTALQLQKTRDAMWELIKEERDHRKLDGGFKVGNNWYHSDTSSRIQQIGLVMMGAAIPPGLMWKTMSGSFVQMTPQLAGQIFQAAAASDTIVFATAEQKRVEMLASSQPNTYNYLIGWPPTYGE